MTCRGGSGNKRQELQVLALLALFCGVPALSVFVGFERGRMVFFLYREPKLVVMMILGWALLAASAWMIAPRFNWSQLRHVFEQRPILWLGALLGYMWLSLSWSVVPQNAIYELQQHSMLFMVLVLLLIWDQVDSRVWFLVLAAMTISIGCVVVIGLFQGVGGLEFLEPIDPSDLVSYPSLMGYKNPMAMAVLGQLFLLAGVVVTWVPSRRFWSNLLFFVLLATQLSYLVALQSRTAMLGLATGTLWLVVLMTAWNRSQRRVLAAFLLIVVVFVVMAFASLLNPKVERKVRSVLSFVSQPRSFLESDRGTYFVNTLGMVRANPLGVGIGDWQTHYPLYRAKNRYLWFDERFQVRRAHSDHVQLLGELGVPGIALWMGFLLSLVGYSIRGCRGGRLTLAPFVAAQLVAFITAMGTDYVIEHPYGKLQFYLVLFLCLSHREGVRIPIDGELVHRGALRVVASVLTAVALINGIYFACLARKILLSGHLTRSYLAALPTQWDSEDGLEGSVSPDRPALLNATIGYGSEFNETPGHTKSMFRDYLLVADALHRLGNDSAATAFLFHSLSLHPFNPPSFKLMSEIARGSKDSSEWSDAYDYIMNSATVGFNISYPPGHPMDPLRK